MNNDFINLMIERRSVRKFQSVLPEQEKIDEILKAGTYAPTGMNRQSPIIIAITDKKVRDKLSVLNQEIGGWKAGYDPFYGAPVILAVLAKKESPTRVYDGSLVMGNLLLASHAVGLGGCWIHRAKETFEREEGKALLKALNITEEYEGIGFCAVGIPDNVSMKASPRKKDYIYYIE